MNAPVQYTMEYWVKPEGRDWQHVVHRFIGMNLDEARRHVQMTKFQHGVIYNVTLSETPVPEPKPAKRTASWKQNPLTRFAPKRSK